MFRNKLSPNALPNSLPWMHCLVWENPFFPTFPHNNLLPPERRNPVLHALYGSWEADQFYRQALEPRGTEKVKWHQKDQRNLRTLLSSHRCKRKSGKGIFHSQLILPHRPTTKILSWVQKWDDNIITVFTK